MTTRIRPATVQDADAIIAMAQRFLMESAYGQLLTVDQARLANLARLVLTDGVGCAFLGQAGDGPGLWKSVGLIAAIAGPHPLSGDGTIEELVWWMNPEARGGRLGYQLLRSLEDWGRQEGHLMLKMVAPADSPAVGRVYERLGYRAIETVWMKKLTCHE